LRGKENKKTGHKGENAKKEKEKKGLIEEKQRKGLANTTLNHQKRHGRGEKEKPVTGGKPEGKRKLVNRISNLR